MADGIVNFGLIQPEASGAFLRGFQGAQDRNRLLAQQEQQNQLAALQLKAAQRGEEDVLAQRAAYKAEDPVKALFAAGYGQQAIAASKAMQEQQAAQLKQAQEAHKVAKDIVGRIVGLPTRENAAAVLDDAEKRWGIDLSQYRAELAQTPDAGIGKWAFTHGFGADKALEQSVIQLPGGGTAVEPKYAIGAAPIAAPIAAPAAASMAAPAMPAGIPGQTMPTRVNALGMPPLPAPGGAAPGATITPSGGRYYPPGMTPAQQAAEARSQQQLGMERERLDLQKEEAARRRAELPAEIRKELTSIDQQRSIISGALDAVKNTPSAFSFARGAAASALPYGESLMGRTETPEQTQARAYVFNNVSRVINERAGAAQSAQEMQRLRSFLPADTDNADQIANKLKGFQTYLADLEKGTVKAAPVAAKEQLEKTRAPEQQKTKLTAIDQQALDWANANPTDPRSAKIKQKLGVQ